MLRFVFLWALLACLAPLTGTPARADTFAVTLGKTALGTLSHSRDGKTETLTSTLNNTPLGVFDGSFTGTSQPSTTAGPDSTTFEGNSASSRKSRQVRVTLAGGRAVETLVTPSAEMTPLSDPSRVPDGMVDPVQAVGQLIAAPDCPRAITLYDGRRVIALTLQEMVQEETTQTCDISYRVIAGPGHLSPLKITKAKMRLTYETTNGSRALTRMQLSSGVFKLRLERQN